MNPHYDYYEEARTHSIESQEKLKQVLEIFREISHSDIYSVVVINKGILKNDKKTMEKMQAFIDKLKVQQDHSE